MFKFSQHKTKRKNDASSSTGKVFKTVGVALLTLILIGLLIHHSNTKRYETMMAHHHAGVAYYQQEQYQLSVEEFSRAIEIMPEYSHAYYGRANSLNKLGEHLSALDDCQTALGLDDTYAPGYATRGYTYLMLGLYDAALTDLNTATELEPGRAYFYTVRGYTYLEMENYDAAVTDFTEAIRLYPMSAHRFNPYSNRAYANFRLGNMETVFNDYDRALEIEPDNPRIYAYRATTYYELGSEYYTLAVADYGTYAAFGGEFEPFMSGQLNDMYNALERQD